MYRSCGEKKPTLTANWNSSWLAAGAAPAVMAGKLVVKESFGKDWHRWWASGKAMPLCHCSTWTDELRLKEKTGDPHGWWKGNNLHWVSCFLISRLRDAIARGYLKKAFSKSEASKDQTWEFHFNALTLSPGSLVISWRSNKRSCKYVSSGRLLLLGSAGYFITN